MSECGFCHGRPVLNAPRPWDAAYMGACPRCGVLTLPDVTSADPDLTRDGALTHEEKS